MSGFPSLNIFFVKNGNYTILSHTNKLPFQTEWTVSFVCQNAICISEIPLNVIDCEMNFCDNNKNEIEIIYFPFREYLWIDVDILRHQAYDHRQVQWTHRVLHCTIAVGLASNQEHGCKLSMTQNCIQFCKENEKEKKKSYSTLMIPWFVQRIPILNVNWYYLRFYSKKAKGLHRHL